MLMMYLISFIMSTLFMTMNHPLSLGSILLIQTLSISIITGMMYSNFWYSYIILLIMIGGMLIMFMYMTSIASNEKFKIPKNMVMMTTIPLISLIIYFIDSWYNYLPMKTNIYNWFLPSLKKFYNWPNLLLSIMMMSFLLLTLIAIVKITDKKMGPMRQKYD
uniref:NADH-ubiquinone oxidoreductase chain 6 n=1 Tax=Scolytinae sp. BMNH 1040146 TaxID=1903785 RepID=A0A343A564_9CUCU|nr:NADH dehydrogenase subunit 6 [Scolytinae sp. BMNH 1040146]